ncbi:MAG: BspA family leucine-rich repeat surface protein [Lachnospiraceae bacterium]|nr:BspA family leucine-rich repeat surface protein [Lachnospiraceae bacterium]
MNKRFWKKCLIGILCVALLCTNVLLTGISVFATETEINRAIVEEDLIKENIASDAEDDKIADNIVEDEEEKKEFTEESAIEDGEEQGNADSENENDQEKSDIENGVVDSETDHGEDTDVAEEEEKDIADDLTSEDADNQIELVSASDDIASGSYGDITWVIDASGKLTVNGTGEILLDDPYVTQPWYDKRSYIKSAEINVTGSTSAAGLFEYCSNLEYVDLKNFETDNITNMRFMFNGCKNLTNIEGLSGNTSNVTSMAGMFWDCNKITSIDLSNVDTSNVTSMAFMFYDCYKLNSLDLSNFDTGNVVSMASMFGHCLNLNTLNVSSFKTGKVIDMDYMFLDCPQLTSVDVSGFDTSNVTTMEDLFRGCYNLVSLDVSGFDTRNVTSMGGMFSSCKKLTDLDVSNFKTSSVTDMEGMFYNCEKLTNIDVSGFDTRNVTSMRYLFMKCYDLTSLDLSSFDVSNVTDFYEMLDGCIDLNKINTPYNLSEVVNLPGSTWYLSDGTKITELPQNLNYSVVIMKNEVPTEETFEKHLITFDANGGSVDTKTMETNEMGRIQSFPKATLAGTTFGGWYTEPVFGDRVSTDTVFKEDTTLYARYFTENEIRYKDDMASFINKISYNMTDSDKKNFYRNIKGWSQFAVSLDYVFQYMNKSGNICYGVSCAIAANKMGQFSLGSYGKDCFNDISKDNINFRSALTVYQLSQITAAAKNEQGRFAKLSIEQKLKEVVERAEEVNTKGPSIFLFRYEKTNAEYDHAILIDGIEYGDVEVGGNTYYYTVKTYDINSNEGIPEYFTNNNGENIKNPKFNPDLSYIYISKNFDSWTMKLEQYFNGEKQSGFVGCKELLGVYNDEKIINSYKYEEPSLISRILRLNDAIGNTYSLNINGTETEIADGVTTENYDTGVYTIGEIADSDGGSTSATIFLPDDSSEFILKKEGNDNISVMYALGYDLVNVEALKADELRFKQSVDAVKIIGNKSSYHLDLIKDEISVDEINISGQTKGDISVQYDSGGFLLSSTGEQTISVSINGNEQELYGNINEQDIFIMDAGNTVKIFVDEDDDGIYEKELTGDGSIGDNNDPEKDKPSNNGAESSSTGENNSEKTDGKWQSSNKIDVSEGIGVGINIETWKPTTLDEKKRYACVGNEAVQYTLDKDNPYRLIIEKAMQGPLCFDSFEAVLGDYTIGRTYNIYIYPVKVYSTDEEVQFTINIPKAIYKPDREYKMICVTKNGLPIVYKDLDKNPETITVRTNKFYAYALIYKDME